MYNLLVLALPYLVNAGRHEVWQKPMMETGDIKIPLTITDNNEFFFPALDSSNNLTRLELEALQTIINDGATNSRTQGISINIPLDPKEPGSISLEQTMGPSLQYILESNSKHVWTETEGPGKDIWIEYVGLRRGGMIVMDAYVARLAPETPYITLPSEIYDVIALASKPERVQTSTGFEDVVTCESVPKFLDIILGLMPEEEDEEMTEEGEVVIEPEQYVMKVEQGELEGKCILLARRAEQEGTEEVVLGWAAMRGREVVLDWGNAKTGMGK